MAKRATTNGTTSDGPAPQSNGPTDALIRDYARRALDKKRALNEKVYEAASFRGEYRSVLKSAKKVGINQDMLARVIADLERDHDDVKRDLQDYIRIAALMRMPTTQMDLFPGGDVTVDVPTEDDEKHSLWVAHGEGYIAGANGHEIDKSCKYLQGQETWISFRSGWHEGQTFLAKGFSQPKATGTRSRSGNPEDRPAA